MIKILFKSIQICNQIIQKFKAGEITPNKFNKIGNKHVIDTLAVCSENVAKICAQKKKAGPPVPPRSEKSHISLFQILKIQGAGNYLIIFQYKKM